MTELEILRRAERAVMQLVIDLHYLAGHDAAGAVAEHLRAVADKLNELAIELRGLAGV